MERRRHWTTRVPGVIGGRVHIDQATDAVFVGDGWGVAYAALAVRRLGLSDGVESARVRTRSRAAAAMTVVGEHLLICTDRRVIVSDRRTLEPVEAYDYSGARWANRIAANAELVVVTNPGLPSIAVIDRATGTSARRAVAAEPSLIARGDAIEVYSAVDPRVRTVVAASVAPKRKTITSALVGPVNGPNAAAWAQVAGRSDDATGETLAAAECLDLTTGRSVSIAPGLRLVAVGDGTLWTLDASRGPRHLQVWSQHDGALIGEARWEAEDGDVRAVEPCHGTEGDGSRHRAIVVTGVSVGDDQTDLTAWHVTV